MPVPTRPPQLDATLTAFSTWATDFGRYADPRTIDALISTASVLAGDLAALGTAWATLTPGNSTRYELVVTNLDTDAANGLGGRHLIALPLQRRCAVISLDGLLLPEYVMDAFRLDRSDDALLYAGVLNLTGDLLAP